MMQTILDNATLWIGDGRRMDGHVVVRDGVIEAVERGRYAGANGVVDLAGAALSPGLIDIMVNGGFGHSPFLGEVLPLARDYLPLGVTSIQMCTGSRPWEELATAAESCDRAVAYEDTDAARVTGLYMEGPFLESKGAHLQRHLRAPTPDHVRYVLDRFGTSMQMINVSPGTEHCVEAIGACCAAGKTVTMAHSSASAEEVHACLDAGTSQLGHAWDNNNGRQTEPGSPQPTLEHVALVDPRVRFLHVITDGVHVHPVLVNLMVRCRGLESICVVSDALPCTGIAEHEMEHDDGRGIFRQEGAWRITESGSLMGTALLLPDQFRNFVDMTGVAPHEAVRTVTGNPAAALDLQDRIGLLAPGRSADLVAWDERLRVTRVWRAGAEVAEVVS